MTPVCPFVKAARPDDASTRKPGESHSKNQAEHDGKDLKESSDSASISPKCPFGYDSHSFKLGPFSCMICQALLFESSKCVPCSHIYCKACISAFKDCPLCGADIEKVEADPNLQNVVDRFIDGHARIKRPQVNADSKESGQQNNKIIYEDVSIERGAFLVQQAMRAFRAHNVESAKSRLSLCAEDIREQLERLGNTPELYSQLGAVLGMLGDCWFFPSLSFYYIAIFIYRFIFLNVYLCIGIYGFTALVLFLYVCFFPLLFSFLLSCLTIIC